jgi:hypothetical protein
MVFPKLPLFRTPTSHQELQEWLEGLSGYERALATQAVAMTMNLYAHLYNPPEEVHLVD